MAGRNGTALAERTNEAVAVEPAKNQIGRAMAIQMVKQLADARYDEAVAAADAKRRNLEAAIGGHTKRVDDTVVDQAKALMTRLALIVSSQEKTYSTDSGTADVKKCVTKIGEVLGILQTVMLTSKAIGLFETIDKEEFKPYAYGDNPLEFAGKKIKKEAKALLEGYEIIEDPPKGKRGKKSDEPVKSVSVDELAAELDDDEDEDESEDGE